MTARWILSDGPIQTFPPEVSQIGFQGVDVSRLMDGEWQWWDSGLVHAGRWTGTEFEFVRGPGYSYDLDGNGPSPVMEDLFGPNTILRGPRYDSSQGFPSGSRYRGVGSVALGSVGLYTDGSEIAPIHDVAVITIDSDGVCHLGDTASYATLVPGFTHPIPFIDPYAEELVLIDRQMAPNPPYFIAQAVSPPPYPAQRWSYAGGTLTHVWTGTVPDLAEEPNQAHVHGRYRYPHNFGSGGVPAALKLYNILTEEDFDQTAVDRYFGFNGTYQYATNFDGPNNFSAFVSGSNGFVRTILGTNSSTVVEADYPDEMGGLPLDTGGYNLQGDVARVAASYGPGAMGEYYVYVPQLDIYWRGHPDHDEGVGDVSALFYDEDNQVMYLGFNYEGDDPGPQIWTLTSPATDYYWRNLAINPSGEQSYNQAWGASNGSVQTNVTWEV